MPAPLPDIALDLAEASRLVVTRIVSTLEPASSGGADDVAREADLYAAAVLIWSLQRPGSAAPYHRAPELLVHWLEVFEPHYLEEHQAFFEAADERATEYIVVWEHDAEAAAQNATRLFNAHIRDKAAPDQMAELAEILSAARVATDTFVQAAFAR